MEALHDDNTTVILDAAHNPQKMAALVKSLKQAYPNQKFTVLLALLRSRDARVQGVLEQLLPITDELIITDFVAGQDLRKYATVPEQIVTVCHQQGFTNVSIELDNKKAFDLLMQSDAKHKLITGSFYLLHDLRESLAPLRSKTH
jgi:folylpolyglutamate synthase/dihydropteroate synthase